jgi:hypothetical protein
MPSELLCPALSTIGVSIGAGQARLQLLFIGKLLVLLHTKVMKELGALLYEPTNPKLHVEYANDPACHYKTPD